MRRALRVWYVLLSAYVVARLVVNRLTMSRWGLDGELLGHVVAVPLAQLPLVLLLTRRTPSAPEGA